MKTNEYLKKVSEYFNRESDERFVSQAEVVKELGFTVNRNSKLYLRGWYKGEFMFYDEYLVRRHREKHPDDPNLKYLYCDPSNVSLDFDIDIDDI